MSAFSADEWSGESVTRLRRPRVVGKVRGYEQHVGGPRRRSANLRQPEGREGNTAGVPPQLPVEPGHEVRRSRRRAARPPLCSAERPEPARADPAPGAGGEPLVPEGAAGEGRPAPPVQT